MVIRVYWGHKLSNHTKLSYTMMSLLFAASGLFSRTIITNKLLVIIVREKCGLPHHINYFCSPT